MSRQEFRDVLFKEINLLLENTKPKDAYQGLYFEILKEQISKRVNIYKYILKIVDKYYDDIPINYNIVKKLAKAIVNINPELSFFSISCIKDDYIKEIEKI